MFLKFPYNLKEGYLRRVFHFIIVDSIRTFFCYKFYVSLLISLKHPPHRPTDRYMHIHKYIWIHVCIYFSNIKSENEEENRKYWTFFFFYLWLTLLRFISIYLFCILFYNMLFNIKKYSILTILNTYSNPQMWMFTFTVGTLLNIYGKQNLENYLLFLPKQLNSTLKINCVCWK